MLAPPIAPLERRLILTRLVQAWSATVDRERLRLAPDVPFLVPASPADAVGLAGDLEALMDAFTTEGRGLDEARRGGRGRLLRLFRDHRRIRAHRRRELARDPGRAPGERPGPPAHVAHRGGGGAAPARAARAPVIAAGSTGSVPATAALLAAIARLPHGAVVLPGPRHGSRRAELAGDRRSRGREPTRCTAIRRPCCAGFSTPICASAARRSGSSARRRTGPRRGSACSPRPCGPPTPPTAGPRCRRRSARASPGRAAQGLALVEAADEREEALAIAIALRETLEDPGRTAALVTPDRALAGRVAAELARWGIAVEDSAGVRLAETPCGRLARLAADAAALDFAAARVLALLAHPLRRSAGRAPQVERAAAALEIGVLRGPAPAQGLAACARRSRPAATDAVRRKPRPERRLAEADWDLADALLDRLEAAFRGFTADDMAEDALDLVALGRPSPAAVEALLAPADEAAARADDDDGSAEALAALFDDLALSDVGGIAGPLRRLSRLLRGAREAAHAQPAAPRQPSPR